MKKFFMFLAVMGVMAFSAQNVAAQDAAEPTATESVQTLDGPEEVPMHQALKTSSSLVLISSLSSVSPIR